MTEPNGRPEKLRILLGGGTGMVGTAFREYAEGLGHSVTTLVRRETRNASEVEWAPDEELLEIPANAQFDAVINLAGANIAERWTESHKKAIRESRVNSTRMLAEWIAKQPTETRPRVLVNGSAVGYYGNSGDQWIDESSPRGSGFLSGVVEDWEAAARPAGEAGVRVVFARLGVVLSARGGALGKMLPPFRMGVGGPVGTGLQYMSWISLRDAARALLFLAMKDDASGPINVVSPQATTNGDFSTALGRAINRPAVFPTPPFALRLMFGAELVDETLLVSLRVKPTRLTELGFGYDHPNVDTALAFAVGDN